MDKRFDDSVRAIPEGDHVYEIVPGTEDGQHMYTVYCRDAANRRVRCGDVAAHCSAPDRAVHASFKIAFDADAELYLRRRNAAIARLRRKLAPWFDRCQRLTLWELYEQHCDAFFHAHAHIWSDSTQVQYRSMFIRHLMPIYSLYSLPFSAETFSSFRQRFAQIGNLQSGSYNNIVDKSTVFLRYLELRGYVIGVRYDMPRREPDRAEQLRLRFAAVRSIGWDFRARLLRTLLDAVYADGDDAPLALCLLLMMLCGLRTAEALGTHFSDFKGAYLYVSQQAHGRRISRALKSAQAYRWTPVVSVLRSAINHRCAYLKKYVRKAGERSNLPLVSSSKSIYEPEREAAVVEYFKRIFREIGLSDQILTHYTQLMAEIPLHEIRNEDTSVYAYILRRDYITRLYSTSLSPQMIDYLSAHQQQDKQRYRPTRDELEPALHALEQHCSEMSFAPPASYTAADFSPQKIVRLPVLTHAVFSLDPDQLLRVATAEPESSLTIRLAEEAEAAASAHVTLGITADSTPPFPSVRGLVRALPDHSGEPSE